MSYNTSAVNREEVDDLSEWKGVLHRFTWSNNLAMLSSRLLVGLSIPETEESDMG